MDILRTIFGVASRLAVPNLSTAMQKINCVNLVPPKKDVPRPHCNMGDGREGECWIYLGKKAHCNFHSPKFKPLPKDEIELKVSKIEKDNEYVARCLSAGICPDCGHELTIIADDEHGLDDGNCYICSKTWPVY